MRLQALRERGRVVDFALAFANEAAARLMRCDPQALLGKGLRANVAGPLGHPALIERYRQSADALHTQAQRSYARGDTAAALASLRSAALYLQRALAAAGVITPLPTDDKP